MLDELAELEHLWTTDKEKYVLVGSEGGTLMPVKLGGKDPIGLIIEDDALAAEVCRRMKEAGVKVVTSLAAAESDP